MPADDPGEIVTAGAQRRRPLDMRLVTRMGDRLR